MTIRFAMSRSPSVSPNARTSPSKFLRSSALAKARTIGLRGSVRKRSSSVGDGWPRPLGARRSEAREVDARRDDLHAIGLVVVVEFVLLAHLLAGAGDHQGGSLDGSLLSFDALGEVIGLLAGFALGLESQLLDPAKRVTGEDERDAKQLGELRAEIASVRVVPMDDVRGALLHSDVARELVEKAIEMRPERLLAKIAPRAKRNADDLGALADRFEGSGVALVDAAVLDEPGHDVDPFHTGVLGQRPRLVDHVRDLPAGVCVPAELDVCCAHQAVDGER